MRDTKQQLTVSVIWIVMALLAGCAAVGPDYVPPDLTVPEQWDTELSGGLTANPLDSELLAGWWSTLNDPVLTGLIKRAVKGNRDLRKSLARLREARARLGISKSDRFPELTTSGSATLSRSNGDERKLFNAGFDAGWEIDLFGRVQRSVEAAEAELEASRENRRDVLVSLLAEVALNYVELRSLQTRLVITTQNIEVQEETFRFTQWRWEAGLTSQMDLEEAKSDLEETRAQLPSLQTGIDQALNRLAVLLGKNPGALHQELKEQAPIPVTPIEIAIGIPADVLRRVPTVREAERQLAAQTARIGVAMAERYPTFTLNGSIGLESTSIDTLFLADNRVLRIGPRFSWTLFDSGRIRQNIEVQNALCEQALVNYEQAILTALEDVKNALTAYAKEQVRRQFLIEALKARRKALDMARDLYSSGLVDFEEVLDAQRSSLSLQNQVTVSEGNVTSDLIRLYKALGGGWTSLAGDEEKVTLFYGGEH